MSEFKVSAEGSRLISAWVNAATELERAVELVERRREEQRTAAAELARWMLPDDVQEGEKIACWFGDSLIQVECCGWMEHKVTVRKRGQRYYELGLKS